MAPIQAQHKYTLGFSAVALEGDCWSFIASLSSHSHLLAFARLPFLQIWLRLRLCLPSLTAVGTSIEPCSILLNYPPSRNLIMGKNVAHFTFRIVLCFLPVQQPVEHQCEAVVLSFGSVLDVACRRAYWIWRFRNVHGCYISALLLRSRLFQSFKPQASSEFEGQENSWSCESYV